MNTVTFPGLGLTFHLDPVAFSLGDFDIYWYGIIIAFGFVLGGGFCCLQAKKFGLKPDDILDLLLFAAPGGILGARLYYIVFNPSLYRNADGSWNLKACLNVHNGGLAIYGGILFGVLIAWLVARHKKIPFPALADACVFGLLIGQIAGRWGNFVNREAYGRETGLPWRMGIQETVNGVEQTLEVHPTFLYESLWNLVGFCLLLVILYKGLRRFDGQLFLLYVAWYGFGRGLIEGLRTDSLYFFSTGIRTSQMVGFVSFAVAAGLLLWKLSRKPDPKDLYVYQVNQTGKETT
ncbi:MAG: prolipoprotein diacylglyceryl transferase [Bacillota bacterium]|nr:prolipoprotein diacylglyceryl transferase [Bacillota bacterium]